MFLRRLSKKKRMRAAPLCAAMLSAFLALVLPVAGLGAAPGVSVDSNEDGAADRWYVTAEDGTFVVLVDSDFDGNADHEVRYDEQNRKVSEKLDFDHDGLMDDFYFYEEGRLVRQEIDTNFDGAIDVWVRLDGLYVLGYERDKDFDGTVDVVKHFDQ